MARMVRKQLYLERGHDARLKALARSSRRSEANIVREAIEAYSASATARVAPDEHAWQEALQFMRGLAGRGTSRRGPARVERETLYSEMLRRGRRRPR
jgi:hypothetical protein